MDDEKTLPRAWFCVRTALPIPMLATGDKPARHEHPVADSWIPCDGQLVGMYVKPEEELAANDAAANVHSISDTGEVRCSWAEEAEKRRREKRVIPLTDPRRMP